MSISIRTYITADQNVTIEGVEQIHEWQVNFPREEWQETDGNIAYINTNGIVLDATAPVISGIENGKAYCATQSVKVTDKYIGTVTVNGTEVSPDKNGQFVLSPASGKRTVAVTDKAGNETVFAVTVNNSHSGGTATCKEKAVCEACGEGYGELNANNHADLKRTDAKAATETAEGNIEYWYCEDCDKYFADKDGLKEITKADTVTAKLPEEKPTPPATRTVWRRRNPKRGNATILAIAKTFVETT